MYLTEYRIPMRHDAANSDFPRTSGRESGTDNERMPEHVRMCPGGLDAGGCSEPTQAAGGGVPVHPGGSAVEQDRPVRAIGDGPVDGAADGRRQWNQDDLGAFPAHAQHPVAVLLAQVGDVRAGGLENPQAKEPEHGTSAKSHGSDDWRAAVSSASNCRRVKPKVGDSAATLGRRTCSAGESSRTPSMTQVR
jgi:hypothetical protein